MKKLFTLLSLALLSEALFSQTGSQEFIASGTFSVPDGVTLITIEVVGAGGNGSSNGGGGGGGGGYANGQYTVAPGDELTVEVGVAGSGAVAGTTSVGTFIYASGGENGFQVNNPDIGGGGVGGEGTGGTIGNYTGGTGGGGYYTYFGGGGAGAAGPLGNGSDGGNTIAWNGSNCLTPGGDGGMSGGAPGGDGGKGAGFIDNFCNVSDPSVNGANYGGGGGGGNGNGGSAAAGANGYCLISWGIATSTPQLHVKNAPAVFPNLFVSKINFHNSNGNELYELVNCIGQVVWSGKNIEAQDFSYLACGFYLLKINSGNVKSDLRLIKQ